MAKSVCIVGAGPSGLVAAKNLLHGAPQGTFKVSIFDAQHGLGGLWPSSKTDNGRQVHPMMVANQSKHTMQFSDAAWEADVPQLPRAWMVGQYLEKYHERYLERDAGFELKLKSRVVKAERKDGDVEGWKVVVKSDAGEETREFDYLIVASGYFGKPIIPECLSKSSTIPVIHSSEYRDLKALLGKGGKAGKILVVGGQMSGVEIAGTIASHLSSAANSPDESDIPDIGDYSVHHVVQRPIWVFPLYTTPEPASPAAPFLPLDFASYNRSNRQPPLVNTQGHITEDTAKTVHGIFEAALGNDQSAFSPLLHANDETRSKPPYLAVSDWYCDFVRSGLITLSTGKVESLSDSTATITPSGESIQDIAAVVVATGFDPSPCLDFLPKETLDAMQHSPKHLDQSLALAFHGTHHPSVPHLGFVGFYRSPYWGVMQMQARFLAKFWADSDDANIQRKLQSDESIQCTLQLRDDPRLSQFPMGDYAYLLQEFSQALSIDMQSLPTDGIPTLPHNKLPLDMLTPSRYPAPTDDVQAKADAETSLKDTQQVTISGLTTPRFVARGVFRSLLGKWTLERDLQSVLPSHPSGYFSGTAQFLLRDATSDGIQCATDTANSSTPSASDPSLSDTTLEYLYIEDGEFKTAQGFSFRATRRYIYRYDELTDKLSVWFAKPEEQKRADYLFHEVEFLQPQDGRQGGWVAKAGHLCVDDYYDVKYNFRFKSVNLERWGIEYTVKGPKKDYTIRGTYTR